MSSRLPIPHRLQTEDWYCFPACVQMVLAYWGIERRQSRLARQLQTIPDAGTPGSNVLRLASRRLDITYQSGTLADLEDALRQGIPPIVLVRTGELAYWNIDTAHAVVLLAIEGDIAVVQDPALEQPGIEVLTGELLLAWDVMVNMYALIRKK